MHPGCLTNIDRGKMDPGYNFSKWIRIDIIQATDSMEYEMESDSRQPLSIFIIVV